MTPNSAVSALGAAEAAGVRPSYYGGDGSLTLRYQRKTLMQVWHDDESGRWLRATKSKHGWTSQTIAGSRYDAATKPSLSELVQAGAVTYPDALTALGGADALRKAVETANHVPFVDPNW